MKLHFCSLLFVAAFALTAPTKLYSLASTRRLTPDDLFRLQEIDQKFFPRVFFSPDGKWVAYVLKRSVISSPNTKKDYGDYTRGDVWLVSTGGGEAINLTNGAADESSFWNPVWSPDSERLALVSTRGGRVTPWVVDRSSRRLRQVASPTINPWDSIKLFWISDRVVAYVSRPEGEWAQDLAMREWKKSWEGREATASVRESGVPAVTASRPKDALIFVDVEKNTTQVVGEGEFSELKLSPDKRYLAAMETVYPLNIQSDRTNTFDSLIEFQLAVFSADGKRIPVEKTPAHLQMDWEHWHSGFIRWAPEGSRLALFGKVQGQSAVIVYQIGRDAMGVRSSDLVVPENLRTREMLWSRAGDLVLLAESVSTPKQSQAGRVDWWILTSSGEARNVTASMKTSPSQLVADTGSVLIGLADGKLWRVFADGRSPLEILPDPPSKFTSLVWPDDAELSSSAIGFEGLHRVLVSGNGEGEQDNNLYEVDLPTRKIHIFIKPIVESELTAYEPNTSQATFVANTSSGTYLWLMNAVSSKTVVETNTFLREIDAGDTREIEYRGLDGQELKAWMLLPRHYEPGKRYPMVTWVYAGSIAGEKPPFITKLNLDLAYNLQLLAAQGYTVLFPSMPLKVPVDNNGEADDPYLELSKGVLTAVDKAIELGYADPDRLGLMGVSYGGYSTYGLVTQTNRFKAAIAASGFADLISLYGTFLAVQRYESSPAGSLGITGLFERGQNRMGNPPWKDWTRYMRNSPLFYVDRVQTPLMMVKGDMDYIAMQQDEEFFTALYRQNKRASFVRYWGENHVLKSPANIRDLWHRTYAWFDEFLNVSRDEVGEIIWDGAKVKSRGSVPPLKPEDFARFDEIEIRSRQQSAQKPK